MSQDQQPFSESAAAPTAPEVYSAAQLRAEVMANAGAGDMGAFHPAASRAAPLEPAPETPAAAPHAPAAPTPAPGPDVASELARMRAEVLALQQQAAKPDEPEKPAEPPKPAHPLEAHARTVLGDGAQPRHLERAVSLLEQGMQWEAFLRHHEANPTPAAETEKKRAHAAMAKLRSDLDDLRELAGLHGELAAIKAEREAAKKPTPEQQAKERETFLTEKIFTADVLGKHHPHLWASMQANPLARGYVIDQLLRLPYDNRERFLAQGDEILHRLDAQCAPASQAPGTVATTPAAPAPQRSSTVPSAPASAGEQAPLSSSDFWRNVRNNFEARANN